MNVVKVEKVVLQKTSCFDEKCAICCNGMHLWVNGHYSLLLKGMAGYINTTASSVDNLRYFLKSYQINFTFKTP